jgi:hypothetical protein
MTNQRAASTNGGHQMAIADRHTLEAIFHHPVPHNLSWTDTLRLLTHLGSADEKADGKYFLKLNGRHLIFRKPHSKNLNARELTDLRNYFASAGISPEKCYGMPPATKPPSIDVVALVDHHSAKLYLIDLSS